MSLTKEKAVDIVSEKTGVNKKIVRAALESYFSLAKSHLSEGDRVFMFGVGIVDSVKRKPRIGRNPITGDPVNIPARKKLTIRSSAGMDEALNKK